MKIPTANIVVAFNKETMERLFSSGATYKSLVAELSDGNKDALLFNNVANPNFISFEHSFVRQQFKMVLTFIDPKGQFESRFVNNPIKIIQQFFNSEAQKTKSSKTDNSEDIKQSQKGYPKEDLDKFKKDLEKSVGQREVYVAYGTGNNLSLWSGPHRTILHDASIDVKGVRKITLTLVPNPNALNETTNINLQGLNIRYSGESQEINFLDDIIYNPNDYLSLPDVEIEKIDFHAIIVDTIRSYVQNATGNKNVIVLLPDINKICSQGISDEDKKYTSKLFRKALAVKKTLESFGLKLDTVKKGTKGWSSPQVIPNGLVPASYEESINAKTAFNDYYEQRYFTAILEKTDINIPNHVKVLQDVFDKIKKLAQGSYKMFNVVHLEETNTNILKLWGSMPWNKYYSLAGYDDFTENSSAIIVGDAALIREYLYGALDGGASPAPLHPLDGSLLNNKEYIDQIKELFAIKNIGSFGDISDLPDEFAYRDDLFTKEQKFFIKKFQIPTFKYNTQNPNILDMKFNFKAVYLAALQVMGVEKEIKRLASAVGEGVLPPGIGSLQSVNREEAIDYEKTKEFSTGLGNETKKEEITAVATEASLELAKKVNPNSSEDAADSVATLIDILNDTNLNGKILIEQILKATPNTILSDVIHYLYRKALQINITTLPLFYVSKISDFNSPCIVFAQDQPITQNIRQERSGINTFFSGVYKILGFKHVITTSEAKSQFYLAKNDPDFKAEED